MDHEPRHLLGRHDEEAEVDGGPEEQEPPEEVAPADHQDHPHQAKEERQELVGPSGHEVVVPRLRAPAHVLLDDPVAHASPHAAGQPVGAREKARIEERPYAVEDASADQPPAPVPQQAHHCRYAQRRNHEPNGYDASRVVRQAHDARRGIIVGQNQSKRLLHQADQGHPWGRVRVARSTSSAPGAPRRGHRHPSALHRCALMRKRNAPRPASVR